MDEPASKVEKPKEERRFSQEQYDMLKRCSEKKDMTEWNEWRKNNPNDDIRLAQANLKNAHLQNAHLEDAYFGGAHLEDTDFFFTHLERAQFWFAHLENAKLCFAHLNGAEFIETHLEGASFENAIVNGSTLFFECKVDQYRNDERYTDFRGVGLNSVRIEPGIKQLLEYNIRRKNWEEWYKEHKWMKWLVKPFWWMSDYGRSTGRIIFTFFGLAFIFANIYYHWGRIAPPGIVSNLFVDEMGVIVPWWLMPLRTFYFSIVTMTTLGFGDMYANAQSIWGHILLAIQVILGYVLLGALITRFAVLFTAGGPAGEFSNEKKKKAAEGTENTEKRIDSSLRSE